MQKDIDGLPRRVNDQFNNQGDMVNFVLVGSQEQVQSALEAANWHVADIDNKEAVMKAVLETYQKQDYLAMPMSQLYLFGRKQDFGYELAQPTPLWPAVTTSASGKRPPPGMAKPCGPAPAPTILDLKKISATEA